MEIEDKLDKELKFSYNAKYGYLTSSPTGLGTGLRASVILHLPGLSKTQNLPKILEAVNDLGMNMKNMYSERSRIKGCIYQISNKQTLGICEKDIVKNLKAIVEKIIEQEMTIEDVSQTFIETIDVAKAQMKMWRQIMVAVFGVLLLIGLSSLVPRWFGLNLHMAIPVISGIVILTIAVLVAQKKRIASIQSKDKEN